MKMYSVSLIPTREYNAKIIADRAERWLLGSIGLCEPTPEAAAAFATDNLPADEVGVYYTVRALEIDIEQG